MPIAQMPIKFIPQIWTILLNRCEKLTPYEFPLFYLWMITILNNWNNFMLIKLVKNLHCRSLAWPGCVKILTFHWEHENTKKRRKIMKINFENNFMKTQWIKFLCFNVHKILEQSVCTRLWELLKFGAFLKLLKICSKFWTRSHVRANESRLYWFVNIENVNLNKLAAKKKEKSI